MPIRAVGGGASERREQEYWNLAGEPDCSEKKRGLGNTVDKPRLGDTLHPSSGQGDDLSAKEKLKIAMAQSAQRGRPSGWDRLGRLEFFYAGFGRLRHSSKTLSQVKDAGNRHADARSSGDVTNVYIPAEFPQAGNVTNLELPVQHDSRYSDHLRGSSSNSAPGRMNQ